MIYLFFIIMIAAGLYVKVVFNLLSLLITKFKSFLHLSAENNVGAIPA